MSRLITKIIVYHFFFKLKPKLAVGLVDESGSWLDNWMVGQIPRGSETMIPPKL